MIVISYNEKVRGYTFQSISLYQKNHVFYAAFTLDTSETAQKFLNCIYRMRIALRSDNRARKLGFSLVQPENPSNNVILKGNILEAIQELNLHGYLKGQAKVRLENPEEKEIQAFLKESTLAPIPSQAIEQNKGFAYRCQLV